MDDRLGDTAQRVLYRVALGSLLYLGLGGEYSFLDFQTDPLGPSFASFLVMRSPSGSQEIDQFFSWDSFPGS